MAEGDGPVNALDAALRKALNGSFPSLAKLQLVDYKVRVINSEAATAAGVRVVIESQDEDDVWGTVGVSENVIEASWIALVDSFEYKLCKDEEKAHMTTDPESNDLPKQYDHAAAQQRWYPFWEEQNYFHSEPNPPMKKGRSRSSFRRRTSPAPCTSAMP